MAELHQIFVHVPVAMARSSFEGVVIRYVLLVLRMKSCFHTMGPLGRWTATAFCTSSLVAIGGAQAAVSRPAR